jgi:uncharacterized protein (TIGR02145 family)
MTTTKKFWYNAFALIGAAIMAFSSCENEEEINVPSISTIEVTEITQTSAVSGGNITDAGGATVTARGVCWSTTENPTISDSKTEDGTGAGTFTSNISGLEPNTTYYIRAYATNSAGTGYGSAMWFTTLEAIELAILITTEVTNITQTTAVSGGNITDDGGAAVTARGVCWSTTENPTISDSKTEDGSGAGTFTSNISGLEPNTTYYIRAYATNSTGTGYGSIMSFTTLEVIVDVTDIDGNIYPTVIIGNQVWFAKNLIVTHFNNGEPIPTGLDNSQWTSTTEGAFTIYPHDDVENINSNEDMISAYGVLYNWYAVNDARKLCPVGWHVPTGDDWSALASYINNVNQAGNKLKSCRQVNSPLAGDCATNEHPRWNYDELNWGIDEYGFNALPAGQIQSNGLYYFVGINAYWWTSNEVNNLGQMRYLYNSVGYFDDYYYSKNFGLSVRCLRD